jgi:hypothetical protein
MQANDDNENEEGAVEGLALLNEENPYQGAPIHREEQFLNSNLVNSGTFEKSSLWNTANYIWIAVGHFSLLFVFC